MLLAAAAAAASVKLLIHSHARKRSPHREIRPPPIANNRQLRVRNLLGSPCSTSVVGNWPQRRRCRHPLNATYRQLPPPCLVINRSRDTIRSSSGSSRSSSSSVGATAGHAARPPDPPDPPARPLGRRAAPTAHPQPGRSGCSWPPLARLFIMAIIDHFVVTSIDGDAWRARTNHQLVAHRFAAGPCNDLTYSALYTSLECQAHAIGDR